jgi:tetratricopeptide (TPR) repeat protein
MVLPLKHQAKTFPTDYVYFNNFVGGNRKAWSNYEYDYYFHSIKESVEYLKEIVKEKDEVTVALNCNLSNYLDGAKMKYQYARYLERSSKNWDYAIFGINYIHPDLLKNNKWQSNNVIKTVYHYNNPVAVILKRKDKSDYYGIKELEDGNYKEAEILLKKALKNEPNNVWLFVNLSKAALLMNEQQHFEKYIKEGKNLYPQFEPFYLLEAQMYYNKGEHILADQKISELLKINPRYKNAKPFIEALNIKMKN